MKITFVNKGKDISKTPPKISRIHVLVKYILKIIKDRPYLAHKPNLNKFKWTQSHKIWSPSR